MILDPRLINNLTPTGVPRNVHSVGPAVVWAPFPAVGQALESLGTNPTEMTPFGVERRTRTALNRDTLGPGYSHPSVAAVGFGSIVLLGLASVLWYREIAQTLAPREAAVGVIGVIIAGPLLWYTFFEPSMSHAPTAACLAGFFYGVVDGHFMLDSYGLNPTVNVGADDRRYVGAGWGSPERRSAGGFRWVIGTSGDVWLPLGYMRDHHLTVSGWPLSGDAI